MQSSGTSGRYSCASSGRTRRRRALSLRRHSSRRRPFAEKKGALAAKALFSPEALRASLASFLRQIVEIATEEGSAAGCLLLCVAPLVDDAEVRQFVQNAAAGAAALVERRFRDGISAGEIPTDFPVAARACQVIDLSNGMTMRART